MVKKRQGISVRETLFSVLYINIYLSIDNQGYLNLSLNVKYCDHSTREKEEVSGFYLQETLSRVGVRLEFSPC